MITPAIIDGCKKKSVHSQRLLYNLTVDRLYNVIYRMVTHHQTTQDVLQESYIKVFEKFDQYDAAKGDVYAWMCKISINLSLNFLRQKKLAFDEVETLINHSANDLSALEKLKAEDILDVLSQLPEQYRIIFTLYEIEGYQHQEIADMLQINVHSCRTYLSRAKTKLQELLSQHFQIFQHPQV